MDQPLTQAHLTGAVREIIAHFSKSQGVQNERFDRIDHRLDEMDAKLSAIMEMLAMRQELKKLVHQLQERGLKLNESEIFVS